MPAGLDVRPAVGSTLASAPRLAPLVATCLRTLAGGDDMTSLAGRLPLDLETGVLGRRSRRPLLPTVIPDRLRGGRSWRPIPLL